MSAATTSQRLVTRDGRAFVFPVAAATKILAGVLLALDGSNNLVNGTEAAARRIVGWSNDEVDNSGGSAGDLTAKVNVGIVQLVNSGTNAVTNAHIGKVCFIEDNQTVASVAGTNSVVAGRVLLVDGDGVWVKTGVGETPQPQSVTALAAATSTNGTAGAASANLAALAAEAEKIGDDTRSLYATVADILTAMKALGLAK
jgi:hypothetical protein